MAKHGSIYYTPMTLQTFNTHALLQAPKCNISGFQPQRLRLGGSEEAWFALRVRTKSESFVGSLLQYKGYEAFTPTYCESRKYTDRTRKLQSPLFPGYVFCRFSQEDALSIVNTPSVQRILTNAGQPAPVSDDEIEAVRVTAASGSARPHAYLNVGQKVRVSSGPLAGVEGFLVSSEGRKRLVISTTLLQRAICVELDTDNVVPV